MTPLATGWLFEGFIDVVKQGGILRSVAMGVGGGGYRHPLHWHAD